jgi:putative flippase GtrA
VVALLSDLRGRVHSLGREVAKFGIVGAFCAVVDVGLFNVLHHIVWHIGPLSSKAISTFVASGCSYVGSRYWSFRHRARRGVRRELPIFMLLNVIGLAIAEVCLGFSYYVLQATGPLATNLSGNVVGLGLGTLFRFWAYKRWVFTHPESIEGLSHAEALEDELESIVQL